MGDYNWREKILQIKQKPTLHKERTMTIEDKREKDTLNRHRHEMFQAKLLRKELKNAETKDE